MYIRTYNITYSPNLHCTVPPHSAVHRIQPPHRVDGLSLYSGYVVPSCQHSIDGVPTVEALHVSDSHIVISHANGPLEEEGEEGERRRGTLEGKYYKVN